MDKLTINIDPTDWGNLITKYQPHSPRLDKSDFTQGTINIDTDTNGALSKRKGGPNYNPTLLPGSPKDQYEAIFSDGAHHLLVVSNGEMRYSSGDTIFNSIVGGTGFSTGANFEFATTQDRVYGSNAVNSPQVYDRITSYGGVSYSAPRLKVMGAQAPLTAPTLALAAGGAIPLGAHTYKVTFVYYDSEESNGGPASSPVTTTGGTQTINLSNIPIGGYGVTQRILYRDNNDLNYVQVAIIANNTATTYTDNVSVGVTPVPIPNNNGLPPSFSLIKSWLDRNWLAAVPGDPNTLFYSEAGLPDIFGAENQLLCNQEDPITALIVYFDRLIVFNRRSMGQILGSTPDNFRYAAIPSSIGCVDNRTLQIHVLKGVPVLLWLSERGFYIYDGNAITYISDVIEDLVNYNIRQALQQKNSNAQSTQAQFQSGTPSNGIDLISQPGLITTRGYLDGTNLPGQNPRRDWNDSADWDDASTEQNTLIYDGTNKMRNIRALYFDPSKGIQSGTILNIVSGVPYITLTQAQQQSTESSGGSSGTAPISYTGLAMRFIPTATGTVASASISGFTNPIFVYNVYSHDATNNRPNASLGQVGTVVVTAGVTYWLVLELTNNSVQVSNTAGEFPSGAGTTYQTNGSMYRSGGFWFREGTPSLPHAGWAAATYTISNPPVPQSGQWTSEVKDAQGPNPIANTFTINGVYPTNTSGTLFVEGSNDPFFGSVLVTQSFANPNGYVSFSLSGARYWRVRISLSTTNNLRVPIVGGTINPNFTPSFTLVFSNTTTWISNTIDCTADVTVYNNLSFVGQNYGGGVNTTITATIATSTVDSPAAWSAATFVPFGSHVVRQYARIKLVLTAGQVGGSAPGFYVLSPDVTSLTFSWTIVSNLISSAIDTAVAPPAGWDVFLAQYTTNGGTVQFQMRSSASLVGLSSATFFNVSPGDFPSAVTPFQYTQWKVIITSTDLHVPIVDSVTVQWVYSNVTSVRPASIFVDGRYYVALAEVNQTANNLVLELDLNSKWRRLSGISISTFSFFFNRPYLGLSGSGQIRKFLEGYTDAGSTIELDMRTKSFDFSTQYKDVSEKHKIIGELIIHAKNTGAALQFFYSTDEGTTWFPFFDNNGNSTIQTDNGQDDFFMRLKPAWTAENSLEGQRIMYRVYNNDIYPVQVHSIKFQVFVRKHAPIQGW